MKEQEQEDVKIVQQHIEQLSEHFDSIQIFATRHEPATEDGTITVQIGCGNWFSRYGQVTEWLIKQNERTRINSRKDDDA